MLPEDTLDNRKVAAGTGMVSLSPCSEIEKYTITAAKTQAQVQLTQFDRAQSLQVDNTQPNKMLRRDLPDSAGATIFRLLCIRLLRQSSSAVTYETPR